MNKKPKLYIVSGCNGAGKTTASYTLLPQMLNCYEFVNSDEFAKALAPFGPEKVAVRASRLMLRKIKYLFDKRADFGIETTLASRTLLKMIQQAKEDGYEVTLLYLWLNSPEIAKERIKARIAVGGHNIDPETVIRRYYIGLRYLFDDYIPLCDRWILADNSEMDFKIIAEGKKLSNVKEKVVIKNQASFEMMKNFAEMELDDEQISEYIQS